MMGHFMWKLLGKNNKKLSESNMHASKEICLKIVKPISKKLKAKVTFIDLEKDWE